MVRIFNKGAMFGLDARIALAIFGALSVISGAALYSAIQSSKTTVLLANFREMEKAIEQYYLDTGSLVPLSTTNAAGDLSFLALLEAPSGVTGWNGPYLPYEKPASGDKIEMNGITLTLNYRLSTNSSSHCEQSSPSCHVFIWYGTTDMQLAKAMNELVDGVKATATSDADGNIHYRTNGQIFYKTGLHFDPANSPNT
tara:strand:+ start:1154 stop:1747 length:594 start_codon:yes stop_codon:yes gene_type:complete